MQNAAKSIKPVDMLDFKCLTADLSTVDGRYMEKFTDYVVTVLNDYAGFEVITRLDTATVKVADKSYDLAFHNKSFLADVAEYFDMDEREFVMELNEIGNSVAATTDFEAVISAIDLPSNVTPINATIHIPAGSGPVAEGYDEEESIFDEEVVWVNQPFDMPARPQYKHMTVPKSEDTLPRPKPTAENLFRLMKEYGLDIRRNEMTLNVDVSVRNRKGGGRYNSMFSTPNNVEQAIRNLVTINGLPKDFVGEALQNIMAARSYNPVRDYFDGLAWDGKDYLGMLLDTLPSAPDFDRDFGRVLFEKNLVSGVACEYEQDHRISGVIVLTGKQGAGKSRFIERLAPPIAKAFKGGLTPDFGDKDHMLTLLTCKVAEIAEATATTSKSSREILKAVIDKSTHFIRAPYAAREIEVQRKSLWFMTSNDRALLSDPSGNRRLWVWDLGEDSANNVAANVSDPCPEYSIDGLWAQMVHLYRSGTVRTWLDASEIAKVNEATADNMIKDPIEEALINMFEHQLTIMPSGYAVIKEGVRTVARNRAQVAQLLGLDAHKPAEMNRLTAVLGKLFEKSPTKRAGSVAYIIPAGGNDRSLSGAEIVDMNNRTFD